MKKTLFALAACLTALLLAPAALAVDLPATADEAEVRMFPSVKQALEQYAAIIRMTAPVRTEDGKAVVAFDGAPEADDFENLDAVPIAGKRTSVELLVGGEFEKRFEGRATQDALTYAFQLDEDARTDEWRVEICRSVYGLPGFAAAGVQAVDVRDRFDASGEMAGRVVRCDTDDGDRSWRYACEEGRMRLVRYSLSFRERAHEDRPFYAEAVYSPTDGRMTEYTVQTIRLAPNDREIVFARWYSPGGELRSAYYRVEEDDALVWRAEVGAWRLANDLDRRPDRLPDGLPEHPEALKAPFALPEPDGESTGE